MVKYIFFILLLTRNVWADAPALILTSSQSVKTNRVEYDLPLIESWDSISNAAGYYFYDGTVSDSYTQEYFVTLPFIELTNLLKGVRYFYSVRAVGSNGFSSASSSEYSFLARESKEWYFIWKNGSLVYSNQCIGNQFFQVDEAGVWKSDGLAPWSFGWSANKVIFSNVTTFLP